MPEPNIIDETSVSAGRIFLCTEGDSSKFWRVRVEGNIQTVCYGRIGTDGHELIKTFDSSIVATKATDKLMAEKLGKGYREVSELEAKAAHDAACKVEGASTSTPQKPRRVSKRRAALGQQLTLFLEVEGEVGESSAKQAALVPEAVPPPALALEF
ncbi:WGR domain-containing protein [Armatimonas sp.]|uniref:WGR domain-containing protein n=1 Tax=Armatimonas sp. TaxID=1872638 RepID=UPI0037528C2C